MTAQQHSEAVTRQTQFYIQRVIAAANSVNIGSPIAHLTKDSAQRTVFGALAFATRIIRDAAIILTHTQKYGNKELSQVKDFGAYLLFKIEEVQGATF